MSNEEVARVGVYLIMLTGLWGNLENWMPKREFMQEIGARKKLTKIKAFETWLTIHVGHKGVVGGILADGRR